MTKPGTTPLWVLALLDKDLSAVEYRVWLYLYWRQGDNRHAWPSQETIAQALDLTSEGVRKIIQRLGTKGWVQITRPDHTARGQCLKYQTVHPNGGLGEHPNGHTGVCGPITPTAIPVSPQRRSRAIKGRTHTGTHTGAEQLFFDAAAIHFAGITDQLKARWLEAHPGIDVERELAKAAVWWKNNPRKQRKDIGRFLSNWMNRAEQGFPSRPVAPPFEDPTIEELDARLAKMGLPL